MFRGARSREGIFSQALSFACLIDPYVLHLDLPLMRIEKAFLAAGAEQWRDSFARLPRPLIALLVGRSTKPFVFNAEVANRLIDNAANITFKSCGPLYVTTSRRTPRNVVEVIEANCLRAVTYTAGVRQKGKTLITVCLR